MEFTKGQKIDLAKLARSPRSGKNLMMTELILYAIQQEEKAKNKLQNENKLLLELVSLSFKAADIEDVIDYFESDNKFAKIREKIKALK